MDEKTISNWLGLKDFFNYFLPGILWISDIVFGLLIYNFAVLQSSLDALGHLNDIVLIILILLIPYIVGVLMGFSGYFIHRLDKKIFGKPEKYVISPDSRKKFFCQNFGTVLSCDIRVKIKEVIKSHLKLEISSPSVFFAVQYSLQFCPFAEINKHIDRMTNMMNLHEGFFLPLLFGTVIGFVSIFTHNQLWLVPTSIVLLIATIGTLFRYHYFRESRAKIIYRYFYLWITIKDKNFILSEDD